MRVSMHVSVHACVGAGMCEWVHVCACVIMYSSFAKYIQMYTVQTHIERMYVYTIAI